eukprot:scaffold3651_cov61-Phaeocystis_antarctica.AAC.5
MRRRVQRAVKLFEALVVAPNSPPLTLGGRWVESRLGIRREHGAGRRVLGVSKKPTQAEQGDVWVAALGGGRRTE